MKNLFKIIAVSITLFSIYAFTITTSETIKIVIDAGHGGHDNGATHDLLTEKLIVSQISSKINQMNKNSNIEIYFTRTTDEFMSFETRTNIINNINPDFVLSLHVNSNKNPEASGAEIYVGKKSLFREKSLLLAKGLSNNLKSTNIKFRGIKEAPFYIISKSSCPAILLELGFLSNTNDREFISQDKNQELIAQSILDFIAKSK